MNTGVRRVGPGGPVRSSTARVGALAGVLSALVLVLVAGPAGAQVPPGSQATPLVGSGIVANCPPSTPAALAPGTATINGVTVGFPAAGRCTPLAADAEGSYTVAGSFANPLGFTAECANAGGVVQTRSGVTVPTGTLVNGVAVAAPTTVTTPNAAVVFPGNRTAVLNQVITTPTAVTVNAIVFAGGPIVGQVICGAAVYPLPVDAGAESAAAPGLITPSSTSGDGGLPVGLVLVAGAAILVVLGQIVLGRTIRRRQEGAF